MQALLQGIPGLNQHKGIKGPPAVDTIKLNLGTPPASGAENRFGVIGGDTAGFPNGRRLGDDVVDIELQVVAGFLIGKKVPLGDGVDRNDKPFLSTFPYLAGPDSASTRGRPPGSSRLTRRSRPGGPRHPVPAAEGAHLAPSPPAGPTTDRSSPMAIKRPTLLKLAAPLAVFAALLAVLTFSNGSDSLPESTGASDIAATPTGDTRALIESLQRAVADEPGRADGYAALGDAYLQRARETGEPSFYSRAERAFTAATRRDPRNQTAVLGAGTLALARHDFDRGLELGSRALALAPDTVRPYA